MKIYSNEQFRALLVKMVSHGMADEQTDNQGQVIIYTNFFEWNDSTIRDVPDPNWDN